MRNSERIEVIDALRGVASLAILLFHYIGFIPLMGISVSGAGSFVVAVTRYGYLGVTVFFVLSGYVMAMTASRYHFNPVTGAQFILRRLIRLAPPYWVIVSLIVSTIVFGWSLGYFKNTVVNPSQVLAHFIYAQDLLGFPSIDIAYWTLCIEVQFYLVFTAAMVAMHNCSVIKRVSWFTLLTVVSMLINISGMVPKAWCAGLWYQFGIGLLIFYAERAMSARLALGVILIAVFGIGIYRVQLSDITVILVAGVLLCRNHWLIAAPARIGLMLKLGKISYSLYLVHGFIGLGLGIWFRSSSPRSEMNIWLAITAAAAIAIGFAIVFYYFCERQAVKWSRAVRVGVTADS